MNKKWNFDKILANFKKLEQHLPVILGNEAENHFVEGFKKGGGQTDAGKWKPRKREDRKRPGRAILVDKGILRNDIKRRKTSFKRTVVSTINTDYAVIHNEGGQGLAFGKHSFTMPKREFIGKSKKLNEKTVKIINNELKKLNK